MSKMDGMRRFVVRDQEKPGEFEGILSSIQFMRAELGIESDELRDTLDEAERVYAELKAKARPPSQNQLLYLHELVERTGGVMSGRIDSHGQAQVLIEELKRVHEERLAKARKQARRRGLGTYITARWKSDSGSGAMSRRDDVIYAAVLVALCIVGVVFPTFGIVCLMLGLAGLAVGLPLSRMTDAIEVHMILACAGVAIVVGIVSLVWNGL